MIFSCYEIKNKRKCTELGRERMSNDLVELNDVKLNYINFGDEADYDDASKNSKCCVFLTGTKEVFSFHLTSLLKRLF